jgi:hypothetical protein
MKFEGKLGLLKTYLTGEFDRVIFEAAVAGSVVHEDLGIVLPPKHLTELDRLSYIVH